MDETSEPPGRPGPLTRALRGAYVQRSLVVALIVGTVLNVINQWGVWFGDTHIVWTKLLLTYCVPFCVATYGTYSAFLKD